MKKRKKTMGALYLLITQKTQEKHKYHAAAVTEAYLIVPNKLAVKLIKKTKKITVVAMIKAYA